MNPGFSTNQKCSPTQATVKKITQHQLKSAVIPTPYFSAASTANFWNLFNQSHLGTMMTLRLHSFKYSIVSINQEQKNI